MQSLESDPVDKNLNTFLGWFSIGLGLFQLVAPRTFAQFIGVREDERDNITIVRVVGLREIMGGVGIFTEPRPVGWVRARVAGDMMDMALLDSALMSDDSVDRGRTMMAMAAVIGITIVDFLTTQKLKTNPMSITSGTEENGAVHIQKSITVNRPIAEVYTYWRDFENLANFMSNLESVQNTGNGQSHWMARGDDGSAAEWDVEMMVETPNEQIMWRSIEGSNVNHSGTVMFRPAPGDRGTEIRVEMLYEIPAGNLGLKIGKLFREDPETQLADDLKVFKQIIETGEVVVSDGAVTGKRRSQRPAQPPKDPSERRASGDRGQSMLRSDQRGGM